MGGRGIVRALVVASALVAGLGAVAVQAQDSSYYGPRLIEERDEKHASGEIRSGRRRVTAVVFVQHQGRVLAHRGMTRPPTAIGPITKGMP